MFNTLRSNLLAAAVSAIAFMPVSATSETLNAALTAAYKNSGLIKQNRALLRAADEDVAIAAAAMRPIIGWSASAKHQYGNVTQLSALTGKYADSDISINTLSAGLKLDWLLFDGGVQEQLRKIKEQTVLATRQDLASVETSVLNSAIAIYLSVAQNEQIVSVRKNNVALINEQLRASRDRFEVGEITRTDVALAEARLAAAKAALAVAEGQLKTAQEEYKVVIGHYPKSVAEPANLPKIMDDVQKAQALAMRINPQMLKLQHNVAAADLGVETAKRALVPRVSLSGDYGISNTLDSQAKSRGGSVSLSMSSALYRGGEIPAAARKAIAQRDAARAMLVPTKDTIAQQVAIAYSNLRVAQLGKRASEDQIKAAQIAFDGVREEANLGARTTLDVLNAEQELLNARASLIEAQTREHLAAYGILAATGQLTAKYLNLPVPAYDVNAPSRPEQKPISGLGELLGKLGLDAQGDK